jgi:hypothetical protein
MYDSHGVYLRVLLTIYMHKIHWPIFMSLFFTILSFHWPIFSKIRPVYGKIRPGIARMNFIKNREVGR